MGEFEVWLLLVTLFAVGVIVGWAAQGWRVESRQWAAEEARDREHSVAELTAMFVPPRVERPNPLDLWQQAGGDWEGYGRLMVEHGYAAPGVDVGSGTGGG